MAFKHPSTTQALGNLMSLQPSLALEATDEIHRIDRLEKRLHDKIEQGLRIMELPPDYRNDNSRRQYFKELRALIAEWDGLRE